MFNVFSKTYVLNITQMLSMGMFTLFVPIYVGFENFGYYASLFAVPGFLFALIETFLIVNNKSRVCLRQVSLLLLIAIAINFILLGYKSVVPTVLFSAVLLFKSLVYVFMLRCNLENFSKIYSKTEFYSAITFIFSSVLVFIFAIDLVYVPFVLFFSLNFSFSIFSIYQLKKAGFPFLMTSLTSIVPCKKHSNLVILKAANYRLFEDFIFTFSPLLLSISSGNQLAGAYKFYTSIVKLGVKFYPIRYETYLETIDVLTKALLVRVVWLNIALSLVTLAAFFFILLFFEFLKVDVFDISYNLAVMVVMFPFFAFVTSVYPHKIASINCLWHVSIFVFFVLICVTQLFPSAYGYAVSIAVLFLFFVFYFNILNSIYEKR
jgi:hypothetical protein